jgi:hypothetical protein
MDYYFPKTSDAEEEKRLPTSRSLFALGMPRLHRILQISSPFAFLPLNLLGRAINNGHRTDIIRRRLLMLRRRPSQGPL